MTSFEDKPFIGDIGIEDETIKHIGVIPEAFKPDKILDGSNHLALPGLRSEERRVGQECR